jgi:hypothetical protein
MHLAHSMHCELVTSPPLSSYIWVTCVGQALLHMPHLVHFCSSLCSRVSAIHLKGAKVLNKAINAPRGQILHQNLLNAKAAIVTKIRTAKFNEVMYHPNMYRGPLKLTKRSDMYDGFMKPNPISASTQSGLMGQTRQKGACK